EDPVVRASAEHHLRVWPGIVILLVEWLLITVPGWIAPATMTQFVLMFWGPVLALVALIAWWLFASRLPWVDRWLGILGCGAAAAAAWPFYHASFGLYGVVIYALPVVTTAWVVWILLTPFLHWPVRRVGLLVVFFLAWGYWALVRFEGITGAMAATFQYRWNPTAEEKFLASIAAAKSHTELN